MKLVDQGAHILEIQTFCNESFTSRSGNWFGAVTLVKQLSSSHGTDTATLLPKAPMFVSSGSAPLPIDPVAPYYGMDVSPHWNMRMKNGSLVWFSIDQASKEDVLGPRWGLLRMYGIHVPRESLKGLNNSAIVSGIAIIAQVTDGRRKISNRFAG